MAFAPSSPPHGNFRREGYIASAPSSPPHADSRREAASRHRQRRFQAADLRNGRWQPYDPTDEDAIQTRLWMRFGAIEEKIDQAEEQLACILGDVNLVTSLRQLLREPASLEAAAAAAMAEFSSIADNSGIATGSLRPKSPQSPSGQLHQHGVSPRSASFARASVAKAADSQADSDFHSNIEELVAHCAHSQQEISKQYFTAEAMQRELVDIKDDLALTQSVHQEEVHKLWDLVAECQTTAARREESALDVKSHFVRLEAEHKSLRRSVNQETHKMGEVSRALVCLTSDVDMMEARFSAHISALEADQERQGRSLQGLFATREKIHRRSHPSISQSSHEKAASSAASSPRPSPRSSLTLPLEGAGSPKAKSKSKRPSSPKQVEDLVQIQRRGSGTKK